MPSLCRLIKFLEAFTNIAPTGNKKIANPALSYGFFLNPSSAVEKTITVSYSSVIARISALQVVLNAI